MQPLFADSRLSLIYRFLRSSGRLSNSSHEAEGDYPLEKNRNTKLTKCDVGVRGHEQRTHLDNEASDRDVLCLAYPVHPHDGLFLHRGIPPGVLHHAREFGLVRCFSKFVSLTLCRRQRAVQICFVIVSHPKENRHYTRNLLHANFSSAAMGWAYLLLHYETVPRNLHQTEFRDKEKEK